MNEHIGRQDITVFGLSVAALSFFLMPESYDCPTDFMEMISSRPAADDHSCISDGASITSLGNDSTGTSSSFGQALRSIMIRGVEGFYSPFSILSKNEPSEDDQSTISSHTAKSDISQRTPIPTSSAPLEGLPNTPLGSYRSQNNTTKHSTPTITVDSLEDDESKAARKKRQDINIVKVKQ